MIYNKSMCNNYAVYMKFKKSKTKTSNQVNIRNIVREEIDKSVISKRKSINNSSKAKEDKYYKMSSNKLIVDLLKPSLNSIIKENLSQGITSQVVRSMMKKF